MTRFFFALQKSIRTSTNHRIFFSTQPKERIEILGETPRESNYAHEHPRFPSEKNKRTWRYRIWGFSGLLALLNLALLKKADTPKNLREIIIQSSYANHDENDKSLVYPYKKNE